MVLIQTYLHNTGAGASTGRVLSVWISRDHQRDDQVDPQTSIKLSPTGTSMILPVRRMVSPSRYREVTENDDPNVCCSKFCHTIRAVSKSRALHSWHFQGRGHACRRYRLTPVFSHIKNGLKFSIC